MKSVTRTGETLRCCTNEPGIAASASANNKTSAVSIQVSWAHRQRTPPRPPSRGKWACGAGWLDLSAGSRVLIVVMSDYCLEVRRPLPQQRGQRVPGAGDKEQSHDDHQDATDAHDQLLPLPEERDRAGHLGEGK